jgi:hypothetical protein
MVKPFSFLGGEENSKTRRKASQKQENRWAKKTGGKTQAGSGAVWSSKGDVKAGTNFIEDILSFLYENKQTESRSFRVSVDLWDEIRQKAFLTEGKLPALQIELERKSSNPTRLVVLDENDFLELIETIKNFQK